MTAAEPFRQKSCLEGLKCLPSASDECTIWKTVICHTTVVHAFVRTEKAKRPGEQPIKPWWLIEDSWGCFAGQSGFVEPGSRTKMKCISNNSLPSVIWWVLQRVDRRKAPWSMKLCLNTGSANNPRPNSCNVTASY